MAVTEHNSLASLYPDTPCFSSRRSFLKGSAAVTAGFSTLVGALALPETAQASDPSPNVLGPRLDTRRRSVRSSPYSPGCASKTA
jgi:hypothetical protein